MYHEETETVQETQEPVQLHQDARRSGQTWTRTEIEGDE